MKKFIKKAAATTLSVFGVLSSVPAFCTPEGENNNPPANNGRGHIDPFNMMVVGKYLDSIKDFGNLAMVNKKYGDLANSYRLNPVEASSERDAAFFPQMETYYCSVSDKEFVYTFPNDNIKRLVYLPYSFDSNSYKEVLIYNGIAYDSGRETEDWEYKFDIKDNDPMKGCSITFTKGEKEIVFMFDPSYNGNLYSMLCYDTLLERCSVEIKARPLLKLPTPVDRRFDIPYRSREEIVIPDSVGNIGKHAFEKCFDIQKITIPNSVTSIGREAFLSCIGLTNINIPNSVTRIGDGAFNGCEELEEITIPGSVKIIGNFIFNKCIKLERVTISNGVENIGSFAFNDCFNLTKINIPNSVTSIGKRAFSSCIGLTNINIPNSVTSIEQETFYYCKSLTQINIPSSVKSIGQRAFHYCIGLTSINIPNSVTSIDPNAFSWCVNLNHIEYNGEVYTTVGSFMEAFNAQHNNR